MYLGISTACFYPDLVEENLKTIASLGVKKAEVFFNTASEVTPEFAAMLRKEADARDVQIASVHPYTSLMEGMLLFTDYERRTEDGLREYENYFHCASILGASFLTFHGERNMGPQDTEEKFRRKCEVYRRLCALAQQYGITLAQENVAWCKSGNPAYMRSLYEAVPELRYTLDIKQAHRAGQHWKAFTDAVGDRIVNVHINDFSAKESCMLPGEGQMDYAAFFHELRKLNYQGNAIIEVYRSNFSGIGQMERAVKTLLRYTDI